MEQFRGHVYPATRPPGSTSCWSSWPERMAAAQAVWNSLSPEQQAQLRSLMEAVLEDPMDLAAGRWSAWPEPPARRAHAGWRRYSFEGEGPMSSPGHRPGLPAGAAREHWRTSASSPAALERDRPRPGADRMGEDAARALARLAKLSKSLADEGASPSRSIILLPAAHAPNRADTLTFPYNQRWAMAFWSLVFNADARFAPNASQTAQWNRGAYLAEAMAHCGECHTPRNLAFALDNHEKFAGALPRAGAPTTSLPTRIPASAIGATTRSSLSVQGHANGQAARRRPDGRSGRRQPQPFDAR